MSGTGSDVARLADAVAGLFDRPVKHNRPPAWRVWTPDGLLLFESEYEEVARLLVVLLASQLGPRPILLESPDGVDQCCRDGRWHATPDDESGEHCAGRTQGRGRLSLRLVVTNANPRGA